MKDPLVSTVKVSIYFPGQFAKKGIEGMHFPKNAYSNPDFLKRRYVKTSCWFKIVRNSTDMDRN